MNFKEDYGVIQILVNAGKLIDIFHVMADNW